MPHSSFEIIMFFELVIFIVLGVAVAVIIGLLGKISHSLSQLTKLYQTPVVQPKEEVKAEEDVQENKSQEEPVAPPPIPVLVPVDKEPTASEQKPAIEAPQEMPVKTDAVAQEEDIPFVKPNILQPKPKDLQPEITWDAFQKEDAVANEAQPLPENKQQKNAVEAEPTTPPLPHEPSAFEIRMKAIRNWLIYGRTSGVPEGESAEKLLATTWLLRSGILVILFTTAFLLKLSIDRGILGPEGRVALSYVAGTLLLAFGLHPKMRNNYWSLGQALTGIGLGMLYFSSYALTSMYHLVPPMVGGAIMCLVTITSGMLSDRLNALSVGMVAMVGGYATPLLLSTGTKNFPGLSGYLLLLGVGILWLANRRNWQQLTWLAMLFTYFIFSLAFSHFFAQEDFVIVQISLVLFFMLFSTSIFIHNIRLNLPGGPLEILGLLGNSVLFFILSIIAIKQAYKPTENYAYAPLTLGLAFFYLLHAAFLGKRKQACERNFLLIFCAISGFYLALTFPVILSGHWLGAAWALQALLLLWLGIKMDSRLLKNCAWVLYTVTLLRLAVYEFGGYNNSYAFKVQTENGNFWFGILSRLVQYLIPICSFGVAAHLTITNKQKKDAVLEEGSNSTYKWKSNPAATILASLAFLVLFFFLRFELGSDLQEIMEFSWLAGINLVWLGTAIIALLLLKRGIPGLWTVFAGILIFGTIFRLIYDFIRPNYWMAHYPDYFWSSCFGILMNTAILTAGFIFICRLLTTGMPDNLKTEATYGRICSFVWPIMLFVHTTREWSMIIRYKLPGLKGGGISVLWAIFAFTMVLRGLKKSTAWLRYCGLAMFAVIVMKVFIFDMGHLDAMYRVIAFLVFGVLLMGAAFIYLKFWHNKEEK